MNRYLIGGSEGNLNSPQRPFLEPRNIGNGLPDNAWKTEAPWRTADPARLRPHHIIRCLNSLMGPEDILVTDVGQHQMGGSGLPVFKAPDLLTSGGWEPWATDWEPA